MLKAMVAGVVIAGASLALGGCVVSGQATAGIDGTYRGNGVLSMTITRPGYRVLPPETTNGMVILQAVGNGRVVANVRFNPNGNQCTLQGSQYGSQFVLDPGQVCRGFIAYSRYDIDAVMRIRDARGTVGGASLSLQVQGDVDGQHRDGSHNYGVATWNMSGVR
jgi:hypothetical protein